jgi:hypothetical protein
MTEFSSFMEDVMDTGPFLIFKGYPEKFKFSLRSRSAIHFTTGV